MVKAIMSGCSGFMGRVIADIVASDPEIEIVAGVDVVDNGATAFPVFSTFDAIDVDADVVIDFSSVKVTDAMLDWCGKKNVPVVVCTTGLSEEQLAHLKETAEKTAVLRSANMSLGINLLLKMLKEAAQKLAPAGFDIEIVEKHHNRKLDAPSGTAIALGDAINEAMDNQYHYVFDRSAEKRKRDEKEIGFSAVRGGTIVGDHDIIFAGNDEVITFSHTAYSRAIFAKGAVQAAKYLAGKPAGLYDMADVIG